MSVPTMWEVKKLYDELEALTPEKLASFTDEEIEELNALADQKEEFKKYNKLAYFKPYQYQSEWIAASKVYHQRYMSAGNRLGKTYGACMEIATHLTGLYNEDWEGCRIEQTGNYWCLGVSQESVNNVLMKELLGVSDCRDLRDLGTGSIPRDYIDVFSMVKDGARCLKVRIKHISGEQNTLHFFAATQDESTLMGATVIYCLLDEQMANEEKIYAQCLTRTATTDGYISVTATPELGRTPLWEKFANSQTNDNGDYLYFQNVVWDQCPHLTEARKKALLAGYPEWQHKLRSEGIPVLGEGAVYPFSEEEIDGSITQAEIMANPAEWLLLWSCDFGKSDAKGADPSTLVLLAHNTRLDRTFTLYEWNSKQDARENRLSYMPEHMASIIKSSAFPNAPLLCPHDANNAIEGKANTTRITEFLRCGVNVHRRVFEIPLRYTMGAIEKPKHNRDLVFTIQLINKFLRDGSLKIDTKAMKHTMREFQLYAWQANGKPADKNNHHLDALRLGAISIRDKGAFAFRCIGSGRTTEGNYKKVNQAYRDTRFI
ncbi:TPA: hypothetical protein MBI04_003564 [Klebsiella pneumoniae]|nr:hypothetical protein [Klebsiella pneumoniae]